MSEDNYLHEAIIIVLRARGHSMTAQEIADEVNREVCIHAVMVIQCRQNKFTHE